MGSLATKSMTLLWLLHGSIHSLEVTLDHSGVIVLMTNDPMAKHDPKHPWWTPCIAHGPFFHVHEPLCMNKIKCCYSICMDIDDAQGWKSERSYLVHTLHMMIQYMWYVPQLTISKGINLISPLYDWILGNLCNRKYGRVCSGFVILWVYQSRSDDHHSSTYPDQTVLTDPCVLPQPG